MSARCRIAVLADKDLENQPAVSLLVVRLSQDATLELLDRADLSTVLKEINLSALSGSGSCADRVRTGQLLHADMLMLVTREASPPSGAQVVVSETKHGLRLRTANVAFSTNVEATVDRLVGETERARRKLTENPTLMCAVPPMINRGLTHTDDHLQASYAFLLEQLLLDMPGVYAADMEEAKAIGFEALLSKNDVRRSLPLYLLGEFRFETGNPRQPPMAKLLLRQGETVLGTRAIRRRIPRDSAKLFPPGYAGAAVIRRNRPATRTRLRNGGERVGGAGTAILRDRHGFGSGSAGGSQPVALPRTAPPSPPRHERLRALRRATATKAP